MEQRVCALAASARAQPCRSQTAFEMKPALTEHSLGKALHPRALERQKTCQKLTILDQIPPELGKPTRGRSSCPGSQQALPPPGRARAAARELRFTESDGDGEMTGRRDEDKH